jgi:hypothetical protein
MAGKREKKSDSMARREQVYPRSRYHQMLIASAHQNLDSRSRFVNKIIEKHFDAMSPDQQKMLLDKYKLMTPEQRERPARLEEDEE